MIKKTFANYPFVSRIVLGILLLFIALVSTGIIEGLFAYKKYFPFTGMILLLAATWVLFRIDNKNLSELGLDLTIRNCKFFFIGLFICAIIFFIATAVKNLITGQSIQFNDSFNVGMLLIGCYYLLPNVVVEELLYRGYLFKKVINKTNVIIANILFSMVFMLVHVLDSNIMSSFGAIIMMSITIPIGHLLFATALIKSKTLLFSIGLHLGNNLANRHLLTTVQNEHALYHINGEGLFDTWPSFITFIVVWNGIYLLLIYAIWKWPKNHNE